METRLAITIAPAIQAAIHRSQLGPKEFAGMIGVCPRLVHYWLKGQRVPSLAQLVRVAAAGDMSMSALLCPLDDKIASLAYDAA